ncbi:MAG: LytTR family DNA-binding domain-containing protein [Asticcacaulis sp.]
MTQAVAPEGQTVAPLRRWLADTRGLKLWPFCCAVAAMICLALIATLGSEGLEALIRPTATRSWHATLHSLTSMAAILALSPLLYLAYRRYALSPQNGMSALGGHLILFILFWLGHVLLMVGARKAIYGLIGSHYDFSNGRLLLQMLYEAAKDGPTYVLIMAVLVIGDHYLTPRDAPHTDAKQHDAPMTFRSGNQTCHLYPSEIMWIAAAGNYAELHLTKRPLPVLIRTGLDELHKRLPEDFVRIHRSRLVNRRFITDSVTASSGDFDIRLSDGTSLRGSRRYRKGLEHG